MSKTVDAPYPGSAVSVRRAPSQSRSRDRVERILKEASALVVEQGIDAVRMSELAERAGISIGSLYQYFPNKAAVVLRLAQDLNAEGRACVAAELSKVDDPADFHPALLSIIDGFYAMYVGRPDYRAIWMATQGDRRLQALESEDAAGHADLLAAALQRISGRSRDAVLPIASMLINQIGSGVRGAVAADPGIRQAMLDGFKQMIPRDPCSLLG